MSRMSAIHQELTELGFDAVYQLETDILEMQGICPENWIIEDYIVKQNNLHPNTVTILVEGAAKRKCSKMLADQNRQEDGYL